uniref:Uncharacterized protein n=1 Tax=Lepeophtheirus salmonis TaxID=72036 RepID=A0A0K2VCG3_LEPSM
MKHIDLMLWDYRLEAYHIGILQ